MRHVTKRAIVSPWFTYIYLFITIPLVSILPVFSGIDRVWVMLGACLCVVAIYGVYASLFLRGDAILTAEGVELTNLVRRKKIPWTDIIQAVSVQTGKERVLMLVRKSSRHIKPGTISPHQKWEYRNAVYLPDDEATREFLLKHFGPVELEL